MHIHTYIYMYVRTYIRACIHTYIYMYVRTYIHTCIHTYIHTGIYTCITTCIHTYVTSKQFISNCPNHIILTDIFNFYKLKIVRFRHTVYFALPA